MMNKIFDIASYDPTKVKNMVIEANAGTGKTTSIQGIVSSLVSGIIDLDKILIVTYTEKATEELRHRLIEQFNNSNYNFNLKDLNIFTIHSFCQDVISEFGLDANVSLNLNVINEENYLDEFLDRYLMDIKFETFFISYFGDDNKYASLKNVLKKAILNYYLDNNYEENPNIISFNYAKGAKNDVYEFIDEYLNDKEIFVRRSYDLNKIIRYSKKFSDYFEIAKDCPGYLDSIEGMLNGSKRTIAQLKKSLITEQKEETRLYLMDFINALKKIDLMDYFINQHLKELYKLWQIEKQKNKAQTFNDMLRIVHENLKNTSFVSKIRNKYTYAIIDEFQDTNQIQYNIFKAIFMNDENHHIIVVGDPKQSIYSFQGADVNVYEKAKQEISNNGENLYILNTSYRSSQSMVDAVNHMFSDCFEAILYNNSKACTDSDKNKILYYKGKEINSLFIATSLDGLGIEPNDYAKIICNKIIDFCSFNELGTTNLTYSFGKSGQKNITYKDIAILCRNRNEFSSLEREMRKCGIPFNKYKDSNLYFKKETAHLCSILECINSDNYSGGDLKYLNKALFSDLFGYSLQEIQSKNFYLEDREEIALINKWKSLYNERKFELLFDSIIEDSYLISRLNNLNNFQSLSIYRQLGKNSTEYLYNNHTLSELISYLKNNENTDEQEEEDNNIIEKGTDFNCVQLMTIHASKGLTFPFVISVGGYNPLKSSNIATYHKDNNRIMTFNDGSNKNIEEEAFEEIRRLFYVAYTRSSYGLMIPFYADRKRNSNNVNERIRKISQKYLENHKDECNLEYLPTDYDSLYLYNKSKEILAKADKEKSIGQDLLEGASAKQKQKEEIKKLIDKSYLKTSIKLSYSSLSHPKEIDLEDENDKEKESDGGLSEFDKNAVQINTLVDDSKEMLQIPDKFPKGKEVGTALHEIFELSEFDNYETKLFDLINNTFKKGHLGLNDERIDYVKNIVENTLEASLPEIHGSNYTNKQFKLSTLKESSKKPEADFNFNLNNNRFYKYFNGSIDLLFERNGYFSILDWKSDTLNDNDLLSYSSLNNLKEHTDNHYSIQRVLYSYCLIKWLKQYYNEDEQSIFEKHFGGVYYVYIRGTNKDSGNGIYAQTWKSYQDLLLAYEQIVKEKVK